MRKSHNRKGRRIPIRLLNQVDNEIEKLLKGHIEKVDKIQDDVFIQPTVTTVKMNKSVKIALDARALNQSIAKDKHQMPNLDNLIDMIAEKLDKREGEAWYSSVDMTYAYGQIPLHELTKKHCNFQIVKGEINRNLSLYNGILWPYCNAHRISKINGSHISQYKQCICVYRRSFNCNKTNKAGTLGKSERSIENSGRGEFTVKGREMRNCAGMHRVAGIQINANWPFPS